MAKKNLSSVEQIIPIRSPQMPISSQQAEDFPPEVILLLDVFSRIEARRRTKLRDEQKVVS